jgi:hypothetical protein
MLGTGDSLELALDGCKLSADVPLVTVLAGTLTMGGGVTPQNNKNHGYGGGVYGETGGTFTVKDGEISSNTTNTIRNG